MKRYTAATLLDFSDAEWEQFLNTTVAELLPDDSRLENLLYNCECMVVADILEREQEELIIISGAGQETIAEALRNLIHAIIELRGSDPQEESSPA